LKSVRTRVSLSSVSVGSCSGEILHQAL
jgi:hypothetical protein